MEFSSENGEEKMIVDGKGRAKSAHLSAMKGRQERNTLAERCDSQIGESSKILWRKQQKPLKLRCLWNSIKANKQTKKWLNYTRGGKIKRRAVDQDVEWEWNDSKQKEWMNECKKERWENCKQTPRKWMKEGRKQEKESVNLSSYSIFEMVYVFSKYTIVI